MKCDFSLLQKAALSECCRSIFNNKPCRNSDIPSTHLQINLKGNRRRLCSRGVSGAVRDKPLSFLTASLSLFKALFFAVVGNNKQVQEEWASKKAKVKLKLRSPRTQCEVPYETRCDDVWRKMTTDISLDYAYITEQSRRWKSLSLTLRSRAI